MTDVNWVFDRAIHLMDEQDENSGATLTADTKEYKLRTLSILNVLRNELYPLSDNYPVSENGTRPILPLLTEFEDNIGLDDAVSQGILPYGLAAYLLLGEDNSKANFFNQKYEEMKANFRQRSFAVWEDIPFQF
jgi:hypothetical protein